LYSTFRPDVLSPLADPVLAAIFADEKVAGLAAGSLIRVTLAPDNVMINRIIRVTPQRSHTDPLNRGCRVDVEALTDNNEIIIVEVQITPDYNIIERDLFSASHIFIDTSGKGTTSAQMAAKMPKVIYINILVDYTIRDDNTDIIQPFKIMYTKSPQRVAIDNFSGYNVQLPRLIGMVPDFTDDLYCWY